jgi:hypothetical protein
VNVIAHGIDLDKRRIVVFEDTGNISVELTSFLVSQKTAPALCSENKMDDNIGEGLGHGGENLRGMVTRRKPIDVRVTRRVRPRRAESPQCDSPG